MSWWTLASLTLFSIHLPVFAFLSLHVLPLTHIFVRLQMLARLASNAYLCLSFRWLVYFSVCVSISSWWTICFYWTQVCWINRTWDFWYILIVWCLRSTSPSLFVNIHFHIQDSILLHQSRSIPFFQPQGLFAHVSCSMYAYSTLKCDDIFVGKCRLKAYHIFFPIWFSS